jgi:hypothetical protein
VHIRYAFLHYPNQEVIVTPRDLSPEVLFLTTTSLILLSIMPDAWPDAAADDEQALLMTNWDGGPEDTTIWQPTPKRGKQSVSIRADLLLLVIPALLLLWILITWTTKKHPPGSESDPHSPQSDAFLLNPSFDHTAPPKTRVYRWTVSLITVPSAGEKERA